MSLDNCYKNNHSFEIILSVIDSETNKNRHIVEWCKICGAVRISEEVDGVIHPAKFKSTELPEEIDKLLKEHNTCQLCNGKGYRTQREIHQEKIGGDFPLEDTYFLWNNIDPERKIICKCKGKQ